MLVGKIMPSPHKDIHVLILGISEYDRSHGKAELRLQMELRLSLK